MPNLKREVTIPNIHDYRFYKQDIPNVGELVMIKVLKLGDTSALVELLEYANKQGMVPFTELTRLRVRSVGKIIKKDRVEAVEVIRVDNEKGYIDLGKKKLTPSDSRMTNDRFQKAKLVQRALLHVAVLYNIDPMKMLENISWPLYEKYGHAYLGFRAIADDNTLLDAYTSSFPREVHEDLLLLIRKALDTKKVQLRRDLEITCLGPDGVDAIREVLQAGAAIGEQEPVIPITMQIVAAPEYRMFLMTDDREAGIKKLNDALKYMTEEMTRKGGSVVARKTPYVVGESDEEQDK